MKFQSEGPPEEETDDDEDDFSSTWRPTYCQQWVFDLPNELPPVAFFMGQNIDRSGECDVQPSNGFLLPPVDYPSTHPNPENLKNTRSQEVRRLSGSATLKTAANYEKSKRRLENNDRKVAALEAMHMGPLWQPVTNPFPASQPTPPPTQSMVGQVDTYPGARAQFAYQDQPCKAAEAHSHTQTHNAALGQIAQSQAQNVPQVQLHVQTQDAGQAHSVQVQAHNAAQARSSNYENQTVEVPIAQDSDSDSDNDIYVKMPAHMRPAERCDLAQVLNIYNWEVSHGIQALDNKPIVLKDIQRVFAECKDSKTPFIVAIAGTPADAASRKKTPAPPQLLNYQSYLHLSKPENDQVLGFGFVKIRATGLAGDANDSVGRFQGQVYFYVANESRKKGIGRAIFRKLVKSCSRYALGRERCEFFDPDRSPICDNAPFNVRDYSRLFIEMAVRGKTDADARWLSQLLDKEHFLNVSTIDNYRRIGNHENGIWLDNIVWQHDCQDKESIRENRRLLK